MKVLLFNLLRKLLLSVCLIFLFFTLLAIIDYFLGGDAATPSAILGLFMITAIFAIPYLVFFKKYNKQNNKQNKSNYALKSKSTLSQTRCANCNSSQLSALDDGYRCDHCGTYYHIEKT